MGQKVAHLYDNRAGNPGWGQKQHWQMAGQTPSVSAYDVQDPSHLDDDFFTQIAGGFKKIWNRLPLSAPTMTRRSRFSAQINSVPASRFFQSYAHAGTGQAYSHALTALTEGALHQNFNPNMQGAAELHPATTYDPFPSPGSLYPKVV